MITNIEAKNAKKLLEENKEITILDVRTEEEFNEGHIPNAVNMDVQDHLFKQKVNTLDKEKIYLVHCRSGMRSCAAIEMMDSQGFTNIYHLHQGFLEWEESGLPTE